VAEKLASRQMSLPVFPELTDEQIEGVVSALKEALDRG
jgi:dTDP-4-amino-4,6-dideoxygalactose transaminase